LSSTARVTSVEGGDRHPYPTSHGRARALNAPRAALVETNAAGVPACINRQQVALVREEWRVVDRWWTEEPVYRRYFDCVLASGQALVVFHDAVRGGWFAQKA
jgi:hypothetical protein